MIAERQNSILILATFSFVILTVITNNGCGFSDPNTGVLISIIFGVLTVVSAAIAVYQTLKARGYEKEIKEIKEAVTSYEFLKDKAMELYKMGDYNKSFSVFKKYYTDNNDSTDLHDVINTIFWSETKKILGDLMPMSCNTFILISIIISRMRETQFNKYPDFLVNMIELYQEKFKKEKELVYYLMPIHLISKDYTKARELADKYNAFLHSDNQNELFRKLLIEICNELIDIPY